jgi:hypothetical protein
LIIFHTIRGPIRDVERRAEPVECDCESSFSDSGSRYCNLVRPRASGDFKPSQIHELKLWTQQIQQQTEDAQLAAEKDNLREKLTAALAWNNKLLTTGEPDPENMRRYAIVLTVAICFAQNLRWESNQARCLQRSLLRQGGRR